MVEGSKLDSTSRELRRPRRRVVVRVAGASLGIASIGLGLLVAAGPAGAATHRQAKHSPALLEVLAVPRYGKVLGNDKHFTLYALSTESSGKLVCKGTCLKFWPPLLVSSKVRTVSLGSGVKGKLGFVQRSATTKQVTFNGFPLYLFVKDTGVHEIHGEGVVAFGGTWMLVSPSASTATTTLIKPKSTTKSATTSKSTTTTSHSGY